MARGPGPEDIELLLVDGDNLLHEVRGSRDEGGIAWLLPRLSRWRPERMRIVVALDGHAAPGESPRRRVTAGIEFHHSGSRSADDLLIELLSARSYAGRARTAVVTRDRALTGRARRAGGLTHSVAWLIGQLGGAHPAPPGKPVPTTLVGIGHGRPPAPRSAAAPDEDADPARRWQPGRGATRKTGNPRRGAKASRRR